MLRSQQTIKNSIKQAYKLLEEAAKIKVDAVKFQTFNLDEMTLNLNKNEFKIKNKFKSKNWNNRSLYSIYKEAQFPFNGIKKYLPRQKKLSFDMF